MLKKGEVIPDLTLMDHNNKPVQLKSLLNSGALVIFFYPKNETPGCIAEACEFRDQIEEFEALGARIVGISGDSPASHQKFIKKYNLSYMLLSDSERLGEKSFGVKRNIFGLLPGRVTFVFDETGILKFCFQSAIQTRKHVTEALTFIKGQE